MGFNPDNRRQDLLVCFVVPEIGMKYSTIFSTGKKLTGWIRLYTKLEKKEHIHAWERAQPIESGMGFLNEISHCKSDLLYIRYNSREKPVRVLFYAKLA